jgi:ABC-2 type transport system permease protein
MKVSVEELVGATNEIINRAIVKRRCEQAGVAPDLLARLQRPAGTEQIDVGAAADRERVQRQRQQITGMMVPFFFLFLMFMGIFGMGQHVLTSIIEEKSSRIIEMLLSAVTPFQLMAGKIVGLAGVGLTVVVLWAAAASGAAAWKSLDLSLSPEVFVYLVVYYVLGFFLFTSILAGIGSTCNTLKEAQSLMMPVTLVVIIPMMAWFNLAQNPHGTLARVLSFIPPITPMVMALRLSATSDVPRAETFATLILLGVSVPIVIWAAARVFRTGILMYGKRPRLREILRWVRQS